MHFLLTLKTTESLESPITAAAGAAGSSAHKHCTTKAAKAQAAM